MWQKSCRDNQSSTQRSNFKFIQCGAIRQNKLEVDSDILLVSEVLFYLNIMYMSMLNQALVASTLLMLSRSNNHD